ncbi:MAG: hypothetical protein EA378_05740 [Phycisphaerales bacterium]|nr:MAG: hypothetical protein EA378_05740 [Phycisphaerales bacterium]
MDRTDLAGPALRRGVLMCLAGAIAAFACFGGVAPALGLTFDPDAGDLGPPIPDTIPAEGTPTGDAFRFVFALLTGASEPDNQTLAERFAPVFLDQLPPPAIRATARQLRAALLGDRTPTEFTVVSATDRRLVVDLDGPGVRVRTRLTVHVDEDGRIDGLFAQQAPSKVPLEGDSWDAIDDALAELPGEANLGVYELVEHDGRLGVRTIREVNPEANLALGSTFKLWVLLATGEAVRDGELAWDQKLPIREDRKSLPSGPMWTDEPGTEYAVAHYARRMIEVSDNTATDHLLLEVGRERVEAVMARFCDEPDRNRPFLTTKEMFRIKLGGDVELRERFAAADPDRRREILAGDLPEPNLMLANVWLRPVAIDTIEWFARPRELAETIAALEQLALEDGMRPVADAMRQNPGIAIDRDAFPVVGFKGGSEPGVLNLTWSAERRDGRRFVLTLGWNNTEAILDMMPLIALAERAFARLAAEADE